MMAKIIAPTFIELIVFDGECSNISLAFFKSFESSPISLLPFVGIKISFGFDMVEFVIAFLFAVVFDF